MSRTYRRKNYKDVLGNSWRRKARRVVGFYVNYDTYTTTGNGHGGMWDFKPMNKQQIYQENKWMHGESKCSNARGPNWYYKRMFHKSYRSKENLLTKLSVFIEKAEGSLLNKAKNNFAYEYW